jgi:uncharacterized protein (DUF952 family)
MHIYHVVPSRDWEIWRERSFYEAASIADEGFIHCSFANQLEDVIGRYFGNEAELVVLTIDTDKLISKLIAEPSTGGELYPHIYGPINADSIVDIRPRSNVVG